MRSRRTEAVSDDWRGYRNTRRALIPLRGGSDLKIVGKIGSSLVLFGSGVTPGCSWQRPLIQAPPQERACAQVVILFLDARNFEAQLFSLIDNIARSNAGKVRERIH